MHGCTLLSWSPAGSVKPNAHVLYYKIYYDPLALIVIVKSIVPNTDGATNTNINIDGACGLEVFLNTYIFCKFRCCRYK